MTVVSDLKLAEIDLTGGELAGDSYHQRLAEVAGRGELGWLASSPLAYVVLDRESARLPPDPRCERSCSERSRCVR